MTKGNKHLYWDNKEGSEHSCTIKHIQNTPIPNNYSLLTPSDLWVVSKRIFSLNEIPQERLFGRDLLKNFKQLIDADDERIKQRAAPILNESQLRENEDIREEVNFKDSYLDSSQKTCDFINDALRDQTFLPIFDRIAFGGDINTPIKNGLPLLT